jgi:hypothetical protein
MAQSQDRTVDMRRRGRRRCAAGHMLVLLLPCAAACAGLRDDLVGTWHYEDRSGHWYTLVVSANGGFELYSEGLGAAGHYQATDDGTARFTYDGYSQLRQWPVGTVTLVSAVVQGDTLTLTGSGQQAVTWQRMGNRISWSPPDLACSGVLLLLLAWAVFRLVAYIRDARHSARMRGRQLPTGREVVDGVVGVAAGAAKGTAAAAIYIAVLVVVSLIPPGLYMARMERLHGGPWAPSPGMWEYLVMIALLIGTPFLVRPIWSWIWEWLDLEDRIDRLFRR